MVQKLIEECGFSSGVFNCGESIIIKEIFEKMVREYYMGNHLSHFRLPALLAELVCELSTSSDDKSAINIHIAELAEKICSNYRDNPDIDLYAERAGLSRDRFVRLFGKQIGEPPHRLLMNVRMREAGFMLRYTDLSIKEIAYSTGFSDPLYFSRIFKKYSGKSPKNYKKTLTN